MLRGVEFFWAIQAGILAAFVLQLMEPGYLLHPYYKWLERKSVLGVSDYITSPAGLCPYCVTGQMGLWFGLFLTGFNPLKAILFSAVALLVYQAKEKWIK